MNYGYVKVAASVPRVRVADCKFNAGQIEKEIIIADGKGVQIIAFPELCITGYTCGDLFAQQLLLEEAEMGADADFEQYPSDGYYIHSRYARAFERCTAEYCGGHTER